MMGTDLVLSTSRTYNVKTGKSKSITIGNIKMHNGDKSIRYIVDDPITGVKWISYTKNETKRLWHVAKIESVNVNAKRYNINISVQKSLGILHCKANYHNLVICGQYLLAIGKQCAYFMDLCSPNNNKIKVRIQVPWSNQYNSYCVIAKNVRGCNIETDILKSFICEESANIYIPADVRTFIAKWNDGLFGYTLHILPKEAIPIEMNNRNEYHWHTNWGILIAGYLKTGGDEIVIG